MTPCAALVRECTEAGPSAASALRVRCVDDVWQHARNLSAWQQEYDQIGRGTFRGELHELWLGPVQVFQELTNRELRQRCRIPPGHLWCGITWAPDGSRVNGQTSATDGVMVSASPEEFELSTPDEHRIFGIVAPTALLRQHAERIGHALPMDLEGRPAWRAASADALLRARAGLRQVLDSARDHPASAHRPEDLTPRAQQHVQQAVLDLLLVLWGDAPAEPVRGPASERHRRLVRAVIAQLDAHPEHVPTVPELCERWHVSRRTLQYAFEHVTGQSPAVYLRCLRLNAVQRLLREGRVPQVQDAAAAHGFWSLSQFTADYRRLFGERPSDTRARALAAP